MAPWPEQGNEPKAPDKSCNKSGENSSLDTAKVISGAAEDLEVNATANKGDDKQPAEDVSNLDDGQLRALLDEAITYKCPKDREGKSNLFRELLQEAEADETECGDGRRGGGGSGNASGGGVGSRYYSNSSRRRGRRDAAVSERQTRGGSLQNLVHASSSEFDTGFGYCGPHAGGIGTGGRRKSKRSSGSGSGRDYGVSVSARQREGGSLPSNVNVGGVPGGGMLTLSGLEYPPTSSVFEDVRSCKQAAGKRNSSNKEFVGHTSNDFVASMPVHASTISSASEAVGGGGGGLANNNCVVPRSDFMVIDLGDFGGEGGSEGKGDADGSARGAAHVSGEDEGTELEVLQRAEVTARIPNYTSRATLEVGHGDKKGGHDPTDVDTMVTFPLGLLQCEKGSAVVNGVEQSPLQLPSSYNSVKCIMGSANSGSGTGKGSDVVGEHDSAQHFSVLSLPHNMMMFDVGTNVAGSDVTKRSMVGDSGSKGVVHSMYPMQHLSVLSLAPNSWITTSSLAPGPDVNRLTFHGSSKDCSGETKNKSLDENGNAVNRVDSGNSNSNERKGKQRKTKTNNDRNVIMSQNIEGHRGDKDIESLIKFIESNSDSKGKGAKSTPAHSNGPVSLGGSKQQRSSAGVVGPGTRPRRERAGGEEGEEERSKGGRTNKQVAKGSGKGSKLKKSNSLEEISKTKLEDLTSSTATSVTSSGEGIANSSTLLLRRPKKQTTLDEGEFFVGEKTRVGDRRSWGTEEGQQYYCNDTTTVSADESSSSCSNGRKRRGGGGGEERRKEDGGGMASASLTTSQTSEETEFHVVTKKQRRKKRRSSSGGRSGVGGGGSAGGLFSDEGRRSGVSYTGGHGTYYQNREGGSGAAYYQRKPFVSGAGGGFPPHDRTVDRDGSVMLYHQYRHHHHRPRSPDHLRRKSTSSMPPSDKSDSSDLDSVHSLPVSSTTPKLTLDQTSTSSGSTPQASYADIARMASTNLPQGNINLNPGKWPAMVPSLAKGVATSPPSSSVVIPAPNNNPQFITGPKLNIGVPPVSGSRAATNNNNNPTTPTVPSTSDSIHEDSTSPNSSSSQHESESSHSSVVDVTLPSNKHRHPPPPPTDPRTKKDAMTNTTLDYKLIPPYPDEEQDPKSQISVTPNVAERSTVNILLDGDYPSLEESLGTEKSDHRKPVKSLSSGVVHHNNPCTGQTSPDNNVSAVVTLSLNTLNPESSKGARREESSASSEPEPSAESDLCVEATVIIPRRSQCTTVESVATVGTHRDRARGSRKVPGVGSRPPVILMDESEQEGRYGEGVTTASELTFGFEVNEQLLLLSDGEEEEEGQDSVETKVEYRSDTPEAEKAKATANAGEDFTARFREPSAQPDNYDKIVTFVGRAWDDVLKEMSCMPVHPGSKVQYYSGQ